MECENYRTFSLIFHTSKILLAIISEQLKPFLLPQMFKVESGFVPGRCTREQILNFCQVVENDKQEIV